MDEASTKSSVLLMSKIGAMIGLGLGSLVLGTLPLMVGRYRTKRRLQKRHRGVSNHSSISTSTSDASSSTSGVPAPATNSQVRFAREATKRSPDSLRLRERSNGGPPPEGSSSCRKVSSRSVSPEVAKPREFAGKRVQRSAATWEIRTSRLIAAHARSLGISSLRDSFPDELDSRSTNIDGNNEAYL